MTVFFNFYPDGSHACRLVTTVSTCRYGASCKFLEEKVFFIKPVYVQYIAIGDSFFYSRNSLYNCLCILPCSKSPLFARDFSTILKTSSGYQWVVAVMQCSLPARLKVALPGPLANLG